MDRGLSNKKEKDKKQIVRTSPSIQPNASVYAGENSPSTQRNAIAYAADADAQPNQFLSELEHVLFGGSRQ